MKVINSMENEKSTRLDGMSSFLLEKCTSYMIESLLEIINA